MKLNGVKIIAFGMLLFGNFLSAQHLSKEQIEAKIDSILPLLTLEEKVAMTHAQSKFSSPGVARLGIPELWMSDGPHGVRMEINWDDWGHAGWTNDAITAFPALTALAATFNPDLSEAYGVNVGEEALYRDKDILLGPGVNIYRTPLNGRNFEYMGEDPHLASKMVVPYIKGLQSNGVAACLKHYVLNNQEKWRGHINVEVSDRALYEIYLPAFKAAVEEAGVWSIMSAYNQYRGQYCSHNERLNNEILKGDWEFDGAIITDWGAAHDTEQAAKFGLDIEMGTGTNGLTTNTKSAYDYYYLADPFLEKIKAGELDESLVDDKVRRILRLMFRTNMNKNRGFGSLNNQEHLDVARKIGTEAVVLLKNEEKFFPLNPDKKMTIAVIGDNATRKMTEGGGSSELKAKNEISPLKGLQNRFKNAEILYSLGYHAGPPAYGQVIPSQYDLDSLKIAAIETAKKADVVLFFGGLNKNHHQDCEGGDRLSYHMSYGQDELISEIKKVNENMGVILISGNAVATPWLAEVKGLMQAWYLGSEGGNAIADIISGDVNPSGKLPFTFPKKLEDNAAHAFGELSYPGDSINQYYKEGILVGYRWHDTKKIEPQFAFGEGLSYTDFEFGNIQTDKKRYTADETIKISVGLSNIGEMDGAEVIQVYVGKLNSKVERAQKELKAFRKVHLASKKHDVIDLEIKISDLAYYEESISDWNLEKGKYQLYVGNASNNIPKTIQFEIK